MMARSARKSASWRSMVASVECGFMNHASAIRAARRTATSPLAAIPDGRARALERGQRDAHVLQAKVSALVGDRLARPQALDDLERLDVAAHALLRVQVHGLGLGIAVAEADTEDEAAARDHVERRHLLGDVERLVERPQAYS